VPTLLRNGFDNKGTFVPIAGIFGRTRTNDPLSVSPLTATVGAQVSGKPALDDGDPVRPGKGGSALPEAAPFPNRLERASGGDQARPHRVHYRFGAVGSSELVEDATQMIADCLFADPKPSGDLLVGKPVRNLIEDVQLTER